MIPLLLPGLLLGAGILMHQYVRLFDEDISTMSDQKFYSRIDEVLSLLLDGARTAHEKGHPSLAPFCAFLSESRVAVVRASEAARVEKEAESKSLLTKNLEHSELLHREFSKKMQENLVEKEKKLQDAYAEGDELRRQIADLQKQVDDAASLMGKALKEKKR